MHKAQHLYNIDLRDWFAGLAMQGMIGDSVAATPELATISYNVADAMMAERAKGSEQTTNTLLSADAIASSMVAFASNAEANKWDSLERYDAALERAVKILNAMRRNEAL